MIKTIARKEFMELSRDGRFRLSALLVGVLLLVALGAGWQHLRSAEQQVQAARDIARDHWESQGEKNPHSAAHYGTYAFKPTLPLSFVDQGVDPWTGTATWLEAHRQNEFSIRPAQDATVAQRFGSLTASGVLQHLVPLLIILFTFGAFVGEREQGTLRQVLASGVQRRQLLLGKATGLCGALFVVLFPAAILGAIALLVTSGGAAPTLSRVAVLGAVYLAYFAAFAFMSLAVSAWAPTTRTALVVLLGVWTVNGLIAPRAAVSLASKTHELPTGHELAVAVQDGLTNGVDGLVPPDPDTTWSRLMEEHGVDRMEDLPLDPFAVFLQESEEYGNAVFDYHYLRVWDQFEGQAKTQEWMGLAAPFLAVRALSMGLAGTDVEQHRDFTDVAETYRRDLMRSMNGDLAENGRWGESYRAGPELWESTPRLEYEAPSLLWVLGNRALSLAVLLLWVAGSASWAMASTSRMRVV